MQFQFLEGARDALFIVQSSGDIEWSNRAARDLIARIEAPQGKTPQAPSTKLAYIIGSRLARRVLAVNGTLCEALELKLARLGVVPHQLVAIDISGLDPSSQAVLVALQPPLHAGGASAEDLFATVAHDLKNPLAAVFGYADALLDTSTGQGLTATQREVLTRIRSTAARCIDLVKNYQHLGELNARGLYAPASSTDLNSALESVLQGTWRDESSRSTLKLEVSKSPLPVLVDRIYLDRIIANLVGNAIKFTPPGGTVTVRTAIDGNWAKLEVHNTDTFIEEDERKTIFERYSRGRAGHNVAGSGLGLYIVDRIVTLARGTIELKTSKAEGTTFTVRLPMA